MYRVWVLYQQKFQKFKGVTQGACTFSVHRSIQPEYKMPKNHRYSTQTY